MTTATLEPTIIQTLKDLDQIAATLDQRLCEIATSEGKIAAEGTASELEVSTLRSLEVSVLGAASALKGVHGTN